MNDADIEQADWEEKAAHEARLRRQGICTHGSCIGNSPCTCRNCGKKFDTFEALLEERQEALS